MEANVVPERPSKVTLAVYLLCLQLAISEACALVESSDARVFGSVVAAGILPLILIAALVLGLWLLLHLTTRERKSLARMIILVIAFALAFLILPTSFTILTVAYGIPLVGLFLVLYYTIGKGKNWARMLLLAFGVLGAIFLIPTFLMLVFTDIPLSLLDPYGSLAAPPFSFTPRNIAHATLQIINSGFSIAALILLFQRDSSEWFKAMNPQTEQEKGFKAKPKEIDPEEALIAAASVGNMKEVRDLLRKGTNVNACNEWGLTPLMGAAQGGHVQAGELLLDKGAEINAKQNSGWTTLMVASFKGHLDFVNLLLGKGVDVNVKTEKGVTALMLASSGGFVKVAELIKAHGAKE